MRWVIAHANRCAYSEAYALADLEAGRRRRGAIQVADRRPGRLARGRPRAARVRPAADRRRPDDPRRPVRPAPRAVRRQAGRGDGPARGLRQLPGPDRARPGPPDRARRAACRRSTSSSRRARSSRRRSCRPSRSCPSLLASGDDGRRARPGVVGAVVRRAAIAARTAAGADAAAARSRPGTRSRRSSRPRSASRPTRIVWNLVCSGYVPELAVPWSVATRTMWAEAKPDRVFEESLFWVQTRAIRCNYCMGHCEMLLEVAGLDKDAVAERTRRLAGDDWSAFPPAEQRAYAYARKLTKTPWELTPGRLQDPRKRPRPRAGHGHLLVALPRPLHDPGLRRLPAPPGARQRLPGLLSARTPERRGQNAPSAAKVDPSSIRIAATPGIRAPGSRGSIDFTFRIVKVEALDAPNHAIRIVRNSRCGTRSRPRQSPILP